jgi:hypothetical protein
MAWGDTIVRHEYIEDLVLVVGGGAIIAGAWIAHWLAGLMVGGVVLILLAMLARRHHANHKAHSPPPEASLERKPLEPLERPPELHSAAAWRFHGSHTGHRSK